MQSLAGNGRCKKIGSRNVSPSLRIHQFAANAVLAQRALDSLVEFAQKYAKEHNVL
jgi:hypothetical protein